MKNLLKMNKKLFYTLGVLVCLLGVSENAWASSYYAKLTASAAEGTGSGLVYVASPSTDAEEVADDLSGYAASSDKTSSNNQSTRFYFTAYALAQHGSVFSGWSNPAGNGEPRIFDDGYSNSSNPVLVGVTSKDSDGTNEATIQANFIPNPETPFNVYFLEPIGVGTYAVSSNINYPNPTQGGDPVPSYSNDVITLTATNGEGYGFRRFYYEDAESKKHTIGEIGEKTQTFTLSSEMKKIGCEFVSSWETNYVTSTNGSFTAKNGSTDIVVDADPETTTTMYADYDITLTATPASGYAFYRFVGSDGTNSYMIGEGGLATQTVKIPQGTTSLTAEFTNKPFLAAENVHADLDHAVQSLRREDGSYSGTILVINNYELPAGYYTIPTGVTLLVPRNANQIAPEAQIERINNDDTPSVFKTLTLEDGAHLDVYGDVEIGGTQNCNGTGATGTGRPNSTYCSVLEMEVNSHIILESGAELRAWGFVTGQGEIDARRGSTVREQFQMYDFKGGSTTCVMLWNAEEVFPIMEYFIQNIEAPVTYRPGSALYGSTAMSTSGRAEVKLVGVDGDAAAMFMMNDVPDDKDTWVRKYYDVSTDKQVYEVNNSATLGNILLDLGGYEFNSSYYQLPLTHNMKIKLLTGTMGISQNTELLPGAEIEINKESTVSISSGKSLTLIDATQWGKFIYSSAYAQRIKYRPGGTPTDEVRDISTKEALGNAKLTIHGTFDVQGYLYTTDGNAEITSTNADAGTIIYNNSAPAIHDSIHMVGSIEYKSLCRSKVTYTKMYANPAVLLNTDPLHPTTTTAGTPAGQSFCYLNDKWTQFTVDPDSSCFVYDNYDQYYAKPGAYVAINVTSKEYVKTEGGRKIYNYVGNPDNTYSDAAGTGRLFILMDGCQWWEVENIDNLYRCIHNGDTTFYYWDEDNKEWAEKKYEIKWMNWDGKPVKNGVDVVEYMLPYNAMPKYNSTNPTRPDDVDSTYSFTGWTPAFTKVKSDQTYTATYKGTQIKYTITFKYAEDYYDGAVIDVQQLPRDADLGNGPNVTPRDGWHVRWKPSLGPVTGNATYEVEWIKDLPDYYTITWKNYDGTTLKTTTPVRDASPETVLVDAPAATRDQTAEKTYVFDTWKPAVAAATKDQTYVAQFTPTTRQYTISYFKEDGTTPNATKPSESLTYGATPTPPAVTKENPEDGHTYTLVWMTLDEEKTIQTVTGDASYKPTYLDVINRYTVTATSNIAAGCVISGAGTYDYGTDVELTVTPNPGYRFLRWNDNNTENPRSFTLENNVSLTAVVEQYITDLVMDENDQVTYSKPNTPIHNLYITSDGTNSSYLNGAENLVLSEVDAVQGQAYFDLTLNTWSRHWNAFAVPFEVDLKNTSIVEVKTKAGAATNRTLRYGRDYDIVYYKESVRATSGPSYQCWDYVDSKNKVLTPGEAYLIAFTSHVGTIRFTGEQDGTHHIKVGDGVTVTYTDPADPKDGGWNGIGNPKTYHALLNAGVTECQIHNGDTIGSDSYIAYEMTNKKFVVGKAAFVKVGAAPSVVVERATTQSAITPKAAPRRANTIATGSDRYTVEIMPENGKLADRLFLLVDEDKADEYMDGKDLPKAGVGSTRAQMWVSRYGAKLCKNTIAPTDDQADYPLGIYAPKAGEYTIYVAAQPEGEQALYLTRDGKAIWNLSDGAYPLYLERGATSQYGLRVSAKGPQVATGVDEAVVDAQGETKKVLINNQVYIIREGNVYTIDGQIVK